MFDLFIIRIIYLPVFYIIESKWATFVVWFMRVFLISLEFVRFLF